jgi:hypothetical protein
MPLLGFVRFKLSITAMAVPFRFCDAIAGTNTIAFGLSRVPDDMASVWPAPEYIDYFELLAVKPVVISATPLERKIEEDENDDDETSEDELEAVTARMSAEEYDDVGYVPDLREPRPSSNVERDLDIVGFEELPNFGRRILLINYKPTLDDREVQSTRRNLRRQLRDYTPVWQGRTFEAYCFVDHRSPRDIVDGMLATLDCEEIDDYLLAQPTKMIRADSSGISPLADWMGAGWRNAGSSTHARRRERL